MGTLPFTLECPTPRLGLGEEFRGVLKEGEPASMLPAKGVPIACEVGEISPELQTPPSLPMSSFMAKPSVAGGTVEDVVEEIKELSTGWNGRP